MTNRSKRYKEILKLIDNEKSYSLTEAIEILKKSPPVKFDESIEVALRLGVDPKKSDQQVRSTVFLPHGTGKTLRVIVLAKGEKATEAKDAGADAVGDKELIDKIKGGWTDFDVLVATPDMMRDVGKLGKVLGPRGLMPTPKAGTVTTDVSKAVTELKGGKIEFKLNRHGVINSAVGKLSFTAENIVENINAFFDAVLRAKPASAKGHYLKTSILSSTMGPGLKIKLRSVEAR